ncbi:MAG: FecR domain-containing protein [Pirellulales bacterium]|nr:FecR domain-containing protein [Pirellulales bacterium]
MSKSLPPKQFDELCDLIVALHEKSITPEERERLEAWICRDEAARRIYLQFTHLYANLRWRTMQEPDVTLPVSNGVEAASRKPILGFLGDVCDWGGDFLSRGTIISFLVALGLPSAMVLILVLHLVRQPGVQVSTPSAVVARVTQMHDCVWDQEGSSVQVGADLAAGRRLRLHQGLAELTFHDGSKVLVEGPATFDVQGAKQGFLHVGRLVAHVPKGSEGFTIDTPEATIVDLGTVFGVSVSEDKTVESHVFKGKVEVAMHNAAGTAAEPPLHLEAGQAARISATKIGEKLAVHWITANRRQFVRRLPPPAPAEPKIHFVHRGSANPLDEGWTFNVYQNKKRLPVKPAPDEVGPVMDGQTAAWMLNNNSPGRRFQYKIEKTEELVRVVARQAEQKGWVLRARIKVESGPRNPCYVFFSAGDKSWPLFMGQMRDGTQRLTLVGHSSLGQDAQIHIDNSKDRFVDYELRCAPGQQGADVFVDGQCVATGFQKVDARSTVPLRFGLQDHVGKAMFTLVEWTPLVDSDAEKRRGGGQTQ